MAVTAAQLKCLWRTALGTSLIAAKTAGVGDAVSRDGVEKRRKSLGQAIAQRKAKVRFAVLGNGAGKAGNGKGVIEHHAFLIIEFST